jgi:hypothetical protein
MPFQFFGYGSRFKCGRKLALQPPLKKKAARNSSPLENPIHFFTNNRVTPHSLFALPPYRHLPGTERECGELREFRDELRD